MKNPKAALSSNVLGILRSLLLVAQNDTQKHFLLILITSNLEQVSLPIRLGGLGNFGEGLASHSFIASIHGQIAQRDDADQSLITVKDG